MRILAATTAGAGHLGPMMPFLRGAVAAGADVLLAAPEGVRTDAVPFAVLPDTPPEILGPIFASLPGLPREEANARVLRDVFGTANVNATLPALEALVEQWRPDLVLREPAELASYVAASRAGVPYAQVAIGLGGIERALVTHNTGFADRYGVPLGLPAARLLSLVPPSMEDADRERYRDDAITGGGGSLPDGLPSDERPLVYVTFGSVAAAAGFFPGVYRAALDALAALPVRVLLTLGEAADPAALGPVPGNAHVARWVPQAAVLREAAVAVGHGGFGTTFGALAAGVPAVVLPLFAADQFDNADAVAAIGAGVRVDDPAAVGDAVTALLGDGAARDAAGRVAREMASLPPAESWLDR